MFDNLFQNIDSGVIYQDSKGKVLKVNPKAEKIFRATESELISNSLFSPNYLYLDEKEEKILKNDFPPMAALRTGKVTTAKNITINNKTNKSKIRVNICSYPEFKNGKIFRVFSIIDQVKEQEEENENLIRYEKIFSNSPDAISLTRLDTGDFILVNDSACIISGYSREELLNSSVFKINLWGNEVERQKYLDELSITGRVKDFEAQLIMKSGEIKTGLISAEIIDVDNEKYILSIARDISAQKLNEDRLRQFKNAVDFSTDAIGMSTPEGYHWYQNRAFDQLFGEISTNPPESVFVDNKVGREVFEKTKTRGDWNGEVKMYSRNGKVLDILLRTYSFKDEEGKVVGLVGVHTDITKRKEIENQLIISKHNLDEVEANAHIGNWEINIETKEVKWSEEMFRLFYQDPEREIPDIEEAFEMFHPEDVQYAKNKFNHVLKTGEFVEINHRTNPKLGPVRTLSFKVYARKDGTGEVISTFGLCTDITEQKKIENELKMARYNLEEAQQSVHMGSWELDVETGTGYWSKEMCRLFYQEVTEKIPPLNKFMSFVHPEDKHKVVLEFKQSVEKATENSFEYRTHPKLGPVRIVSCKYYSKLNKNKKVDKVFGILRDVTEQKLAEQKLQLTQFAIDNAQIGIFQINDPGRIMYANKYACKKLGFDEKEILEMNIWDIDVNLTPEKWSLHRQKTKGQMVSVINSKHRKKDGTEFDVEVAINFIEFAGQKLSISFALDITERKKYEDELVIAKERAEENNRLKTAFLNNMSHEIRTPLNVIFGYAGLLGEGELNQEEMQSLTQPILRGATQLQNIIEDVLDISRIETGQVTVNKTETDINNMVEQIIDEQKIRSAKKGLEIKFNKKLGVSNKAIITDDQKLKQILNNLIVNAIKYTIKGYIEINIFKSKKDIKFSVIDTGVGIADKYKDLIFERFQRLETHHSAEYHSSTEGGTGLGLPICKGLVELLGGKIWLESEPGRGSTFYFTIPTE